MNKIKAVFNWSGGKDSAHALWKIIQTGKYEVVALLTTVNRDTHRSTMHGIPLSLLKKQAESIGLPLYIVDLAPQGGMEDYFSAMENAVRHFNPTSTFPSQNFPVIQHLQFLHIYWGYYKFSNSTELG